MHTPVAASATNTAEPISSAVARTLPGLFEIRVRRSPDQIAYRQFDSIRNGWQHYSWRDIAEQVPRWSAALSSEALAPGDRVAVLLPNGVAWVCLDLAALSCGLVPVPLYSADAPENFAYFLEDSGARVIVAAHESQWRAIRACRQGFAELKRVVCGELAEAGGCSDGRVVDLEHWLHRNSNVGSTSSTGSIQPNDLATIIYTSGTTGRPKGVMLSHANMLRAAEGVLERVSAKPDDVFISYLPLAHAFERTVGYYLPMMAGCRVEYARSTRSLPEDLQVIRPTIFVGVPRVFERAFAKAKAEASASAISSFLFKWTETVGWRRFQGEQRQGPPLGPLDRMVWPFLHKFVAERVVAVFGGRVRLAVTGGAPMSQAVARFFVSLGLPVLEGYGFPKRRHRSAAILLRTTSSVRSVSLFPGPRLSSRKRASSWSGLPAS
jgi:long-chain acyl-CoA synthetase